MQAAVGAGARLTPVQHQAFSQLQRAGEAGFAVSLVFLDVFWRLMIRLMMTDVNLMHLVAFLNNFEKVSSFRTFQGFACLSVSEKLALQRNRAKNVLICCCRPFSI